MPRQGDDFHKVVECIERAFLKDPNFKIESPKFLVDKITNQKREHDVVLTYSTHHDFVIAIECRDRSKKITVSQIEEFRTKCENTGVNKGILVSSKGFWKSAIKKANFYNIDCLTLEEIENFNWCKAINITVRNQHVDVLGLYVNSKLKMEGKFRLFHSSNETVHEIKDAILAQFGISVFQQLDSQEKIQDTNGRLIINIENTNDFYLLDELGAKHRVNDLTLDISYSIKVESMPLKFYDYKSDHKVRSAAFSKGEKFNVVVFKEDEGVNFNLIPNKELQ